MTFEVNVCPTTGEYTTYPRNHVGCVNYHLRMVVMSEENKHFRMMSAKRIRNVSVMQFDVWIAFCFFLILGQYDIY
jgi:hypothetical protein